MDRAVEFDININININIEKESKKSEICFVGMHSMVFRHIELIDLPEIGAKRGLELGLSIRA